MQRGAALASLGGPIAGGFVMAIIIMYSLLPLGNAQVGDCPDGSLYAAVVNVQPNTTAYGAMMSVHAKAPNVPNTELARAAEVYSEYTGKSPSDPLPTTSQLGVCVSGDGQHITRIGAVDVDTGTFWAIPDR